MSKFWWNLHFNHRSKIPVINFPATWVGVERQVRPLEQAHVGHCDPQPFLSQPAGTQWALITTVGNFSFKTQRKVALLWREIINSLWLEPSAPLSDFFLALCQDCQVSLNDNRRKWLVVKMKYRPAFLHDTTSIGRHGWGQHQDLGIILETEILPYLYNKRHERDISRRHH